MRRPCKALPRAGSFGCGARRAWKATKLSSVDTLENEEKPVAEGHAHDHDHSHDHDHEGHDHSHAPTLNPEVTREVVLDVPADEVTKIFKGITKAYQKHARLSGFRPGKAPEAFIKRKFANEIRKDVLDQLLPEKFQKAVNDLGVQPVGQPQVTELTLEDGEPLHVKAVFETLPDFSVDGYNDVKVEKPSVEVTEDEYKAEIDQLLESRATVEPVEEEREIVDGDWALISYEGRLEGAAEDAEPIKGEEALVEIGGKDTVAAFTDAIRGAKVGQTLHVSASYPENYPQATLQGKTVDYDIEVKAIKKRTVPELNDEFAKELGEYDDLAGLEKAVRDHLENRKKRSVEGETKDKLFAALVEKFPFAVPESLVQEQVDARLERGLRALAQQGMPMEQIRQMDFGRLREAQRESAVQEVKAGLIIAKIAQAENIEVSDEDVQREVQIGAIQTGESVEALTARLTQDGGLARIREQLKREKTAQLLYDRL